MQNFWTTPRDREEFTATSRERLPTMNGSLIFDPNYLPAINNRGVTFRQLGQHDRALADFDRLLR